MPFQSSVNQYPALGVAGDAASENPRSNIITIGTGNSSGTPPGLVAGSAGVTTGVFAWVAADNVTVNNSNTSTNGLVGFVAREQQALITTYLGEASMLIPAGFGLALFDGGDWLAKNTTGAATTAGGQVYADPATGNLVASTFTNAVTMTGWTYGNTVAANDLAIIRKAAL